MEEVAEKRGAITDMSNVSLVADNKDSTLIAEAQNFNFDVENYVSQLDKSQATEMSEAMVKYKSHMKRDTSTRALYGDATLLQEIILRFLLLRIGGYFGGQILLSKWGSFWGGKACFP